MSIPILSADTARCMGTYRDECQTCLRKLSPPHERQVWMGPWIIEDQRCPSRLSSSTPSGSSAGRGG